MRPQFSQKLIVAGVCALVLTGWPHPSTARADDFETKYLTALAQNAPGLHFDLQLPEGKIRFQIGEAIPVTLSFSNLGGEPLHLVSSAFSSDNLVFFEVEPQNGVADPTGEIPPPLGIAYSGPPAPPPLVLGANLFSATQVVNESLRFARPGIYKLYARTWRVRPGLPPKAKNASPFVAGPITTSVSNQIEVEIIATDPTWAHAQVEAQRALWKQPRRYDENRDAPSFRYLQTREAMDAIIERLGTGERPRSSDDETTHYRLSLVGFLDRPYLIDAMRRAIARPDYPVTQGLLETLTLLRALELKKRDPASLSDVEKAALNARSDRFQAVFDSPIHAVQDQLLPANWNRAADALGAKTGRARAMTIHSLLELAWGNPLLDKTQRTRDLQTQVPAIYRDLPPLPQQYLLDEREWPRIKSPAMRAPLFEVWKSLSPRENDYPYLADAVFTRISELAPLDGRALALREMGAPLPRVSTKILLKLPGGDLPQFDQIWLKTLTTNGNGQDDAALLIGRFASPAIQTEVRRIYEARRREKMLSFDVNRGLQTYLRRVARRSLQSRVLVESRAAR